MKKYMACLLLLGMGALSAMDNSSLELAKKNTPIPKYCCYFGPAVPACQECVKLRNQENKKSTRPCDGSDQAEKQSSWKNWLP